MRQRVITGTIFAIAVIGLYVPSLFVPDLILLLAVPVGVIGTHELIKAFRAGGFKPCVPLIIAGDVIGIANYVASRILSLDLQTSMAFLMLLMLSFCLASVILVPVIRQEEFGDPANDDKGGVGNTFVDGAITAGVILYVTFPLCCLAGTIGLAPNGWFYMVLGLFSSWISDVTAYFAGVTLGRHKIVPHISPKKTWEGCIGGGFGCAIIVTVFADLVIYRLD